MIVSDINLKIIFDSRRKETLEASLYADLRGPLSGPTRTEVIDSVPSGKSTGTHEALVLEPKKAIEKFQEIKSQILGRNFKNQEDFDNFLIFLDGTKNKQNFGGNLILALSLAFARLMAKNEGLELFQYIKENSKLKTQNFKFLRPIFNVINGGAHATDRKSKLDFQEFQIIPEVNDFGMALGLGEEFYKKLGEFLETKFGKENISLGDEAGFCAPFKNNEEAIEILAELTAKYNYPLKIGLDVAASQFYKNGYYIIGDKKYSADELKNLYLKLIESYDILSIEDPFYEESFDDFTKLTRNLTQNLTQNRCETLVIADDLTTTNLERLKTAINKKSGNAILIKPNQIGTLTETLKVIQMAFENNWQAVVSHRSGETMDDFIADLAVGIGAWGIKAGSPAKPERLAKYNRILEIKLRI